MYPKEDRIKLDYILELISDIEYILAKYENTQKALQEIEGHHALLMCIMQIGESLNNLSSEELIRELPVKPAYGMRNYIAHNYSGVNIKIAEKTLDEEIPKLKERIISIL